MNSPTLFRKLTAILCVLSATWFPASGQEPPNHTAYRLPENQTLTIDGDLSDWPNLPLLVLGLQEQVASGNWGGPDDAFAEVRIAWDRDTLYMAIEVIDDSIVRTTPRSQASQVWREDSIQWAVDLNHDGGTSYGDDNYEYMFGMADGEPIVYRRHSASGLPKGIAEHIDLALVHHPQGGSLYEAAVNFSMLQPLRNPEDGHTIGFTIVLQDMDEKNMKKTLQWTPGVTSGKNPSQFGNLIFSRASPTLGDATWMISADRSVAHEGITLRMITSSPASLPHAPVARVFTDDETEVEHVILEPLNSGKTAFTGFLPTRDLVSGDYTIRVLNREEVVLAEHRFTRSDTSRLESMVEALPSRISALREQITNAESKGIQTRYARNAVASASLFLHYTREDIDDQLYDLALHNMEALERAVEQELNRLTAWMKSEDGMPDVMRVPELDYTGVEIDGGRMAVDNETVLLAGPLGWTWGVLDGIEHMPEVGYNSVGISVLAQHYFDKEGRLKSVEEMPLWPVRNSVTRAEELNLSAGVGILPFKVWQGARRRGNMTLDEIREVYDFYARRLIQRATKGRVFDYTITVEGQRPHVEFEKKHHGKIWLDHLKSSYTSVGELNDLYRTEYLSFEDVPFPDSLPDNPAMKYDYTRVRQIMIANEMAWAADKLRALDPGSMVTGYPYVWTFREAASFYEHALDPELDADSMDIVSCDTSGKHQDERYAMATITWMAGYYSLMDSIAGDRPLFDGEFHYVNFRKIYPENWARSIYFHAFIHGLNGNYGWVWSRSPSITSALLLDANVLLGSGRAALDLQRLAKEIAAFHDRPADVLLLYSNSSSPHSRREGDSVLSQRNQTDRIYEGLYFDGLKVGYVTERMLQRGDFNHHVPLIIPNSSHVDPSTRETILDHAASGKHVLLVGDSLLHTPQGVAYPAFPDTETLVYMEAFESADDAREALIPYLRTRAVEADHRPLIHNGKPYPTVEWRCATGADGRELIFLHNLGYDPARVKLPTEFRGATDLLTGIVAEETVELNSLEFMMLRRP